MVKNKTKPTSFRPRGELLEKIDSICEKLDCSRNDYINTVLESAISEDIEENSSGPDRNTIPKEPKTFDCRNGVLFENGISVGNCSDYDLNHGKVYEKNGKYLGQIKNTAEPQKIEI